MQAEIQKLRKKYATRDENGNQALPKPQQLEPLVINSHSPDLTQKGVKPPLSTQANDLAQIRLQDVKRQYESIQLKNANQSFDS